MYADNILKASFITEELHNYITHLQKEFDLIIVEDFTFDLGMNLQYDMKKGELTL